MALSVILTACAGNQVKETVTGSESVQTSEAVSEAEEIASESEEVTEEITQAEFEPGILTENSYTSEWAGLTYTAPENTMMLTKEQINETMGLGAAVLEEEGKGDIVEASKQTSAYEMMNVDNSGQANIIFAVERLPLSFITMDQYVEAFYHSIPQLMQ